MRDSIAFQDLQVDKEASLRYVRKLLRRLDAQPDGVQCLNEAMRMGDEDEPTTPFTHQLCVVCVDLEDAADLDDVSMPRHVDECMDLFRRALRDAHRSDHIRLYKGCAIEDDTICLTAYLHDTPADCDVSNTECRYNVKYRMWLLMGGDAGAPHGVDENDTVWVLDFSRALR